MEQGLRERHGVICSKVLCKEQNDRPLLCVNRGAKLSHDGAGITSGSGRCVFDEKQRPFTPLRSGAQQSGLCWRDVPDRSAQFLKEGLIFSGPPLTGFVEELTQSIEDALLDFERDLFGGRHSGHAEGCVSFSLLVFRQCTGRCYSKSLPLHGKQPGINGLPHREIKRSQRLVDGVVFVSRQELRQRRVQGFDGRLFRRRAKVFFCLLLFSLGRGLYSHQSEHPIPCLQERDCPLT